ncbi:predicted protein [Histoplasma capsulatum var. duboisii H88]|uniref:Predicted protein n=3 Tax=Ajellomyces capsulatus TaxID=5037 RepID=F0UH97_AJEC8|nr:predicted protein [Histoplasma capsulatum H143]EGC44444.1 predicted protein [Histoplasma capsulatum var. duboisii H88]
MASRTIERLPPEILIHCCSYLKGSILDIQNLRLTSKRFCNASSNFLFDTLSIRITTKSISTLEAVSNHPIFRKSITAIKLCLCFYGDIEDQRARIRLIAECDLHFNSIGWTVTRAFNSRQRTVEAEQFNGILFRICEIKQALSALKLEGAETVSPSLDIATLRVIANSIEKYKAQFADQQVAIKHGTHLERIGVALSRFRRLLSFKVLGNIETINKNNYRSCSMATILEWLNSDETCSNIILNVMASRGQYLAFDIEQRFAQSFKGIFSQLSKHKIFPSVFAVELDAPKQTQLFRPKKAECDAIRSVVHKAEHLSFAVRWWSQQNPEFGFVISTDQHYEEIQHLASLTKAFFDTETVRSVDLDIRDYSLHTAPPHISLYRLLPDCEWPQLQALSLVAVPFHEQELRKTVDRHRNSLKILEMDGLQLLSGSWRGALRILRELDKLEEVSWRWPTGGKHGNGSSEDDLIFHFSEKDVCQYLLKTKDAENPLGLGNV